MSGDGQPEGVLRALALAEGYVEDAENVVWEASARADDDLAEDLETLTREIWRVEHALNDLRDQLRSEVTGDREPEVDWPEARS